MISSKLVGAANSQQWSQAHVFKPASKRLMSRGTLLLALSLRVAQPGEEEALDLASFGKEILTRFHELYYGSEAGGSILDHLRQVVKLVGREFSQVRVALVVGVILPTQLPGKVGVSYLCGSGAGSVLVLRSGRLYRVLESRGEGAEQARDPASASGFVEDGDFFLLATGALFQLIPEDRLKQALTTGDPAEVGAILAPQVHGGEDSSGMAVVMASIRSEMRAATVEEEAPQEISQDEGMMISQGVASPLRWGIARVGTMVSRLFSTTGGKELTRPEEIVVRGEEEKRRRLMFSVAAMLLVLLIVSVVLGWQRRTEQEKRKVFNLAWEMSDHQFREAIDLVGLNPLRARALLSEAKQTVEEALTKPDNTFMASDRERLEERQGEIVGLLEEVSGEHRVSDATVFLDLELVRPGTVGDVMSLHGETLVVLDRGSGVLLQVDVMRKAAGAVGGGALLAGAKLSTVYAGRGFVLSEVGIVEVSLSGKTSAVVVRREAEWGEPVNLEVFGGNLYLLDRGRGEIFRYQGIEGGFGSRQRWLAQGVTPDFSAAVDMAIDGDIWVLTQETVTRYRRGAAEPFRLSGLDRQLSDPIALYTDEESQRLYILDRGNRRVVVVDKNGEYREQFLWEGMREVSDMVVSESGGKILFIDGSVIHEIELLK